MEFKQIFQCFTMAVVFVSVNTQNTKDSEECDKNHNTMNIKWPIPATVDGQNVNYMPMMPMAVPVVQGPKGERGAPGTCDNTQCKCDCRSVDSRHERRALRSQQGNYYQRNRPSNEYHRTPGPQNLIASMKGQKGTMGVMGLTGLPGPQGPAGPKGQKGEPGTLGTGRRLPGNKGERGTPGIRGFPGATGLRGPSGPPGQQGRPGSPGRKGDPGLPGRSGPPGRKGDTGKTGKNGLPGKPGKDISSSTEKRVAFTAAMTENIGPVNLATPIKFRDVILNLGVAYNLITGIFTAPYNGTYVISYNALSQYNKAVELTLLHNARVISSIHSRETGGYAGAGNSIVVYLVKDDRLWIELSPGYYFVYGDTGRHTVFSGYLLYPD